MMRSKGKTLKENEKIKALILIQKRDEILWL